MRKKVWLILVIMLVFSQGVFAQEYSYTHYDIADGLASSTVYCITQDKDGFIWVGTEAGVCQFDGVHFRTFTSADGLPDAEVLQLFGDSKGRVWMAPFRGSVCYYYQGRIHNPQNDSMLATIRLRDNSVGNFAEDAQGNVLIQERTALHLVGPDGRVRIFDSAGGVPIDSSAGCGQSRDGHFQVQIGQKIFELSDAGLTSPVPIRLLNPFSLYIAFSPSWSIWRIDPATTTITSWTTGRSVNFPFTYPVSSHVSYSIVDDSLLFDNQYSGTLEYDLRREKVVRRFLPGSRVSRTFRDQGGNLWFTTLGRGLYRLNSETVRNIRFPESGIGVSSVYSIAASAAGDHLLVGDNHDAIYHLPLPDLQSITMGTLGHYGLDRIMFIRDLGGNRYLVGSDALFLAGKIGDRRSFVAHSGIKAACAIDDHRALVGGPGGAGIFDWRAMRITDTVWRNRITSLYSKNDTNYIATLQGLWQLTAKEPPRFMGGEVPFLRNRISALTESPDGVLWVASNDAGIIGYAGGRVIARITRKEGLIGNVCHCLYFHDGVLWVGTDKGLNRIGLNRAGYPITCFSADDGLASDVINVIYGIGQIIYVGTAAGLSYFDETKIRPGDECRLRLLSAISAGRNRIGDTAKLLLPVKENNIRFEFVAIAYRSAGKIRYRYRLIGLDSAWRETQDNYLAYPTLPSGQYEFQIQAVNRYGKLSELCTVPFVVATPFWDQVWFRVLELVVFLSGTWLFASWRIRRARHQQELKAKQNRRMAELEHIALQSQMNPHFIFNCLNSIQQFAFDKDMLATNEYISGFARLIRATLNYSSRSFISVEEEVEYLSDYLSLEKMRFKNKMDYRIVVAPDLDVRGILLPPMLLQPYVENSVRHGLRHKTEGPGHIHIDFKKEGERLVVSIRDNGIGRKKALEYKTSEHIEYQSKGMSLTSARIQMIRVLYKSEIGVKVKDLHDGDGQPEGTLIEISFPVF